VIGMAEYVVDNPGGNDAHGIDLVDGDAPAVRMIVHGVLPRSVEHDGRTWTTTGETEDQDDAPPITVYRPV
jgi:hypothetical protein